MVKMNILPLRWGIRQRCPLLLLQQWTGLASTINQEKGKRHKTEKGISERDKMTVCAENPKVN